MPRGCFTFDREFYNRAQCSTRETLTPGPRPKDKPDEVNNGGDVAEVEPNTNGEEARETATSDVDAEE